VDLRRLARSMMDTFRGSRGGAGEALRFRVRGHLRLELRGPDGALKAVREGHNLVVTAGLNAIKDRLLNPSTTTAVFGYVAIGTGATAEAAGDTALQTEAARAAATYTAGGTGVCTFERTFAAGVGTGAITEAGIFNDATTGTMFNRKTFSAVNKAAGDTLKVVFTVTFAPA